MQYHDTQRKRKQTEENNKGTAGGHPESQSIFTEKRTACSHDTTRTTTPEQDLRRFFIQAGADAFHRGVSRYSSPFAKASLSPFGLELCAAWDEGWTEALKLTPEASVKAPLRASER